MGTSSYRLPLVTLYATERCNSRCVTCDYWRHGRIDLSLGAVTRLLPDLADLGTQVVLMSGGEPLLNPEWPLIAELLKSRGLQVWLLTSGLSLAKHANRVAELFDSVTVSLDAPTLPLTQPSGAWTPSTRYARHTCIVGQRSGARPAGHRAKSELPRVAGLR